MSKDLPYFRFYVSEWLNDDISLESYKVQGVFASVCAYYWFQDCSIAKAKLEKRFKGAKDELEQLFKLGIIKENSEGFAQIKFLDKQYDKLSEKRRRRVEAGRKGGLAKASNAKAKPKQSSSYKEKDKDKEKDRDSPAKPSDLQEVKDYFTSNGYTEESAEKFYNYYEASIEGTKKILWRDSKGNKVRNWKQKARAVWFEDENKISNNGLGYKPEIV